MGNTSCHFNVFKFRRIAWPQEIVQWTLPCYPGAERPIRGSNGPILPFKISKHKEGRYLHLIGHQGASRRLQPLASSDGVTSSLGSKMSWPLRSWPCMNGAGSQWSVQLLPKTLHIHRGEHPLASCILLSADCTWWPVSGLSHQKMQPGFSPRWGERNCLEEGTLDRDWSGREGSSTAI